MLILSLIVSIFCCSALSAQSIIIIDTTDREAYLYQPFVQIAHSLGNQVTYKGLDDLIDMSPAQMFKQKYDAYFFIFDNEFLSGNGRSYLTHRVLEFIDQCHRLRGVLIGLLFPCFKSQSLKNILHPLHFILSKCGFSYSQCESAESFPSVSTEKNTDFLHAALRSYFSNILLTRPLAARTRNYHTTLAAPFKGVSINYEELNDYAQQKDLAVRFLPIGHAAPDELKTVYPYGVYSFQKETGNHLFIGSKSALTFAGISENIHVCPFDQTARLWLIDGLRHACAQLFDLAKNNDSEKILEYLSVAQKKQAHSFFVTQAQYAATASLPQRSREKIVWMDIDIFGEAESEKQQDELIDHIYSSAITGVWLTLNPHMFFSRNAKYAASHRVEHFFSTVKCFARKLKQGALLHKKSLPLVYIGFEIANNLTSDNMPKRYPVDLYENMFNDLPVPVDTTFWDDEIVTPLTTFAHFWKTTQETALIPIAGIVLDLEMYCRKKSSIFTSCMTVDGNTFGLFGKNNHHKEYAGLALRDRVLALIKNKQGRSYFNYLTQKARDLGHHLVTQCGRIIPGSSIVCYSPIIHTSWFYKGLMKGLGQQKKPLKLLTFNSEFKAHKEWFDKLAIKVQHLSVLMLSKIISTGDFGLVDEIMARHHGVWLNKFSRLVQPRSDDWTSIEQAGLEQKDISSFTRYLGAA